jgi:amino acid transporter
VAALIMVSTFGANSGLILSGGRLFYAMAKMVCFSQATELNKNQVPAKALGTMYMGKYLSSFRKIWRFINLYYICLIAVLHIDNYCFLSYVKNQYRTSL